MILRCHENHACGGTYDFLKPRCVWRRSSTREGEIESRGIDHVDGNAWVFAEFIHHEAGSHGSVVSGANAAFQHGYADVAI
jgi:hypothetical protein